MKKLTKWLLMVLACVYFVSPADAFPGLADDIAVIALVILAMRGLEEEE